MMSKCNQNNSFTRITFKSQIEKFSIKCSEDKSKIFFTHPFKIFFTYPQLTTERFQSKEER